MTKGLLCLLACLALCLSLCAAGAEEITPIQLGEGDTTIVVMVQVDDSVLTFSVSTNQSTLLDALLENKLITASQQSWGYLVDSVLGIANNEDGNGLYWNVLKYNVQAESFASLSSGIQSTQLLTGDIFAFVQAQ